MLDEEQKKDTKKGQEKDSDKTKEKKPGSRSSSAKKKPRPAGMSEADRKEQEDIERAIAESMKDLSMDQPDKAKTKTKGSKGVDAVKREKSEDTGLGSVFDQFATYNGKSVGQDMGTRVSVSNTAPMD